MNKANCITCLRFPLTGLAYVFLMLLPKERIIECIGMILALACIIAAWISDYYDGKVARQLEIESKLGGFLDPMADSLLHLTVFGCFVKLGWIWPEAFYLFLCREILSYVYRFVMFLRDRDGKARLSGKWKTGAYATAQIAIVFFAIVNCFVPIPLTAIAIPFILAALATALWSGEDYLWEMTSY